MRSPTRFASSGVQGFLPWDNLWSRRDLLRVGPIGLASALLPGLDVARARATESTSAPSADSVIFLWMAGGVTHLDSFDPKPLAPEEIRGTLAAIDTDLAGVQFAETLPNLARLTHLFALVRSYSHENNDHLLSQAWTLSGRPIPDMSRISTEPNIGSVVSCLLGPRAGLPGYIAVPGITRPGPPPYHLFQGGWLGAQYGPFAVGGEPSQPDFSVGEKSADPSPIANEDLRPQALSIPADLDVDRLLSRSELRGFLDRELAKSESVFGQAMDTHYDSAFRLLGSEKVRRAFDFADEPDALRDSYGRTKIGGRCLLARRLVEAGARFVMVDYGYDPEYGNLWDNHAVPVQKQPHISEMAKRGYHVAGIDRAFAGLLGDLSNRGLLDRTLVVFLTEFGRTPKINSGGGRDHWGPAGSIFFAGGGARGGQVIGATDKQGAFPISRPWNPSHIAATIYRAIGLDLETPLQDREQRPMRVLPEGEPIAGVLG